MSELQRKFERSRDRKIKRTEERSAKYITQLHNQIGKLKRAVDVLTTASESDPVRASARVYYKEIHFRRIERYEHEIEFTKEMEKLEIEAHYAEFQYLKSKGFRP